MLRFFTYTALLLTLTSPLLATESIQDPGTSAQRNYINGEIPLPVEVILGITKHLDHRSTYAFTLTCKHLYNQTNRHQLYADAIENDLREIPIRGPDGHPLVRRLVTSHVASWPKHLSLPYGPALAMTEMYVRARTAPGAEDAMTSVFISGCMGNADAVRLFGTRLLNDIDANFYRIGRPQHQGLNLVDQICHQLNQAPERKARLLRWDMSRLGHSLSEFPGTMALLKTLPMFNEDEDSEEESFSRQESSALNTVIIDIDGVRHEQNSLRQYAYDSHGHTASDNRRERLDLELNSLASRAGKITDLNSVVNLDIDPETLRGASTLFQDILQSVCEQKANRLIALEADLEDEEIRELSEIENFLNLAVDESRVFTSIVTYDDFCKAKSSFVNGLQSFLRKNPAKNAARDWLASDCIGIFDGGASLPILIDAIEHSLCPLLSSELLDVLDEAWIKTTVSETHEGLSSEKKIAFQKDLETAKKVQKYYAYAELYALLNPAKSLRPYIYAAKIFMDGKGWPEEALPFLPSADSKDAVRAKAAFFLVRNYIFATQQEQ